MSTLAIDINDANLVIADESGVLATEPGYALVADGEVLTGNDAYAQTRLKPRQSSNRYWENLSLEEGSAGLEGVDNNAQLAFAQLEDLSTTFIALLISIVVMFLVHQLQSLQERTVFDTQTYVDHNLIRHMQSRGGAH